MISSILHLHAVDEETLYNFQKETNYQFSKNYKPLHCFNDYKGCHTDVLVACGLELTTPLGEPGGAPL